MVRIWFVNVIVVLVLVKIASTAIFNTSLKEVDNALKQVDTRRQSNKKFESSRSTSSSSGEKKDLGDSSSAGDSLRESVSSISDSKKKKKDQPKSSKERRGWRKWHRKCQSCPEMKKKWRDPTIPWICGAYQRARRSFKSSCMMYYRNCQDGTMFVKVHSGRCANESFIKRPYHGEHFFYEYKVKISGDSTETDSSVSSVADDDESYEERR